MGAATNKNSMYLTRNFAGTTTLACVHEATPDVWYGYCEIIVVMRRSKGVYGIGQLVIIAVFGLVSRSL